MVRDATPKHLGGDGNPTIEINSNYFRGKYVVLFDDIITSGRSMSRMKSLLESAGANVICGLSIGKTKHEYARDPIESF